MGNSVIIRSSVVRNLGSYIDDKLSMNSHINKVCNASFYYLHNIRWIRKHLSRHSSETLIHAFVSSWLDYCNSLPYELPQQNATARLMFEQPKFCHITPVLSQLHWLPIKYCIEFKILLMTFKAIHGMVPDYIICKLLSQRKSTGYSLRSSKKVVLEVPCSEILPTLGGTALCYAPPKLWNNLSSKISSIDSVKS